MEKCECLYYSGIANDVRNVVSNSDIYRSLESSLSSLLSSTAQLFKNISDINSLSLILRQSEALLPFFLQLKAKLQNFVAVVLQRVWAGSFSTDDNETKDIDMIRVQAFALVRKLALIGNPEVYQMVLQVSYSKFIKSCRKTDHNTIGAINIMKNSLADLFGLYPQQSYSPAFRFLRQLAIHLRSAVKNDVKDARSLVYNWQYMHSLGFFCTLLSFSAKDKISPLYPLIYPTVQIALGVAPLVPSTQYAPLRFHVLRYLLNISAATNVFIPMAPLIVDILESKALKGKGKPGSLKPVDFEINLKVSTAYVGSSIYNNGIGEQVVELLGDFFYLNGKSVAFPELAICTIVWVKRWLKKATTANPKLRQNLMTLVEKLDAHSALITTKRRQIEGTLDTIAANPDCLNEKQLQDSVLGKYMQVSRRVAAERKKLLVGSKEEEQPNGNGKRSSSKSSKSTRKSRKAKDNDSGSESGISEFLESSDAGDDLRDDDDDESD